MLKEKDFVSWGQANTLRDLGYSDKEDILFAKIKDSKAHLRQLDFAADFSKCELSELGLTDGMYEDAVAAPSLWSTVLWLRKEFGLHICVTGELEYAVFGIDGSPIKGSITNGKFQTYEEATSAAIDKCLEIAADAQSRWNHIFQKRFNNKISQDR